MTKLTTSLCLAAAMALAIGTGVMLSAQDRGPEVRAGRTMIYTSPMSAGTISCNVLNKSNHALEVETHLVLTADNFFDDTSVQSTTTIGAKRATSVSVTAGQVPAGTQFYCRFSFTGNADQVRAVMVVNGAVSSEAR